MEKDDKGSTLIRIGVSGESSFWYRPTRVVPDQRPLNGRCCTSVLMLFGIHSIVSLAVNPQKNRSCVNFVVFSFLYCCEFAWAVQSVAWCCSLCSSKSNLLYVQRNFNVCLQVLVKFHRVDVI